jgi:protein-disulfide isomerase/uncharacterized membrane protein
MKKLINFIFILSAAGAVLSGILLVQHYNPESNFGLLSCGDGIVNPCLAVSQSAFGTIFGIPLAAYGLFFYLFILFLGLIADFSSDKYLNIATVIILPITALAFAFDIILFGTLIYIGEFCRLCIATYIINILILGLSIAAFVNIKKTENTGFINIIKDFFSDNDESSNKKAAYSSFSILIFFLIFSVFSMNYILSLKSNNSVVSKEDIKNFTLGFYSARVEEIQFPESNLVIGNPNAPLTIYAFTDFLCSACYEFYKVEKYLLSKFKDKIKVVYYNFPLDKDCNEKMSRSVYPNSCSASKAMIQSAYTGKFPEYLIEHFKNYKSIHEKYNVEKAISLLPDSMDKVKFQEGMKSHPVTDMLKSHIEFAEKIGISSTPTMFISGRRMSGVAPKEMMEIVIKKELEKAGK